MRGYVAEDVPGDGSCLFHSLGRHLGVSASELRAQVVDTLVQQPLLRIDGTTLKAWTLLDAKMPIRAYARHIGRRDVWGGALEIAIIARLYGRPIHVYQPTPSNRSCRRTQVFHTTGTGTGTGTGTPIRVLFLHGNHYMPLFPQ